MAENANSPTLENLKSTPPEGTAPDSVEWSDDDDSLWSEVPLEHADETTKRDAGDCASASPPIKKKTKLPCPLERFRGRYLWVSDFMSQLWCEQQMHYGFTQPMPAEVVEKPVMTKGTDMHLARELEVQDSVPVKITSDVDIFSIKLFNLYLAVQSFLTGVTVRREIPIFGAPFDHDIFMIGLIDEIRVDPETFDFEIIELKTRRMNSVPSKAQKNTHRMQIMLYKVLFDDLISGKTSQELLERHLKLDFTKNFGEDVVKHLKAASLDCKNLDELWKVLHETMKAVPMISQLFVEYCWQEDKSTIALEECAYDETWLQEKYSQCLQYWTGVREVEGVDIEDAWKCQKCDYADVCEWREKKAEEHRRKNTANMHTR